MAGIRLGNLRSDVSGVYRNQLPSAEMVQGRVPVLGFHTDAGLSSLPDLAPDRRPQHVRVPFCKIRLHFDVYV